MAGVQLTKNFNVDEFRCHCCGHVGTRSLQPLANALQQLRDLVGKPVHLNCGYRCPAHNAAVHGATHSQHMLGAAADITIAGMTPQQVADAAESVPAFHNGGIGLYPTFTHVDVRKGMKRWIE